jgi:prolipoprotein diacylglyceryl transferase
VSKEQLAEIVGKLEQFWVWQMEPNLLQVGPITIRYYGVLFAAGLLLGFYLWRWQMLRPGHDRVVTEKFLIWGVIAVLAGSRLGHCLFYEPEIYLRNPLKILKIWEGGLASHGATVGIITTVWLYAKRYGFSVVEMMDRMALPTCMGALFVRLGNFMNSEIVGRVWDGPWATRFPAYTHMNQNLWENAHSQRLSFVAEALPRHPSQLYEAAGAIVVFLILMAVDRALKEKRPRGLMAGIFLAGYFTFRFVVEYFKEFQSLGRLVVHEDLKVVVMEPTSGLTMGQYLSLPFIALGLALVAYALAKRLPASAPSTKVTGSKTPPPRKKRT